MLQPIAWIYLDSERAIATGESGSSYTVLRQGEDGDCSFLLYRDDQIVARFDHRKTTQNMATGIERLQYILAGGDVSNIAISDFQYVRDFALLDINYRLRTLEDLGIDLQSETDSNASDFRRQVDTIFTVVDMINRRAREIGIPLKPQNEFETEDDRLAPQPS